MRPLRFLLGLTPVLLLTFAVNAEAAIVGVAGGTAAPAGTLGGFTMTAFPNDLRPVINNVNDVPSPLGGVVGFSSALSHREIGNGWSTWSHGYTGDVYYTNGLTSITLTLPALTGAFYFYAEPNPFAVHSFTAIANGGAAQIVQNANGQSGAAYFGFYTTDLNPITTISITTNTDFAIGEFGIAQVQGTSAVPEPASLALFGMGAVGVAVGAVRRRSRQLT